MRAKVLDRDLVKDAIARSYRDQLRAELTGDAEAVTGFQYRIDCFLDQLNEDARKHDPV